MLLKENRMEQLISGLSDHDLPLSKCDESNMRVLLSTSAKEFEQGMNEGTISSDVQQFVPFFLPLLRRVMPRLVANELVGIQPLSTPSGYIFAINFRYTGDSNNSAKPTSVGTIVETKDKIANLTKGKTLKFEKDGQAVDNAKILHFEDNYILVDKKDIKSGSTIASGTTNGQAGATGEVTGVFSNEASFEKVLKGYTGSHTTEAGEKLAEDMAEISFNVERTLIEAKTRKLKAKYTMELYQDLKNIHGLNADEELMNIMSMEVESELNREIIDFVNNNATITPDFEINGIPGRYEIEKFAHLSVRIAQEAREIARLCRRGAGNVIIASPKVVTALESLNGYKCIETQSNISNGANPGVVGVFEGKKVIMDIFAKEDYVTVLYKGNTKTDAGVFYAPYVPLSFVRTTNVESGQPAIIVLSRYGLAANPLGANLYIRRFNVNFNNVKSLA